MLVLEPALPGGVLKTRRKGCGDYEIVARGVAAHAGVDPGKGVSAIRELARQILAVETLQDLSRGVSVNVGVIEGGTRTNVVAAEARARVDVRAPTAADAEQIDRTMRALTPQLPGADPRSRRRLQPAADGAHRQASRSCSSWPGRPGRELGQSIEEGATGGGSDGNFTAALGIPTLDGLGALGDGAHALHEHVLVSSLVAARRTSRALLIARLSALTLLSRRSTLSTAVTPLRATARRPPCARSRRTAHERRQKAALSCATKRNRHGAIRGSPVFSAVTTW